MISRYYHVISEKSHRHHDLLKNLSFEDGFKSLSITDLEGLPVIEEYYNWIYNWITIAKEKLSSSMVYIIKTINLNIFKHTKLYKFS